ncbi:hypothetical protein EGR_04933 [Echinococcus granulosus]|uniref:Uncharacterized protein n=1 Tax=Echinococcus granulosus TaxID=6210 RepID=W6UGV6_ECHGR|nr:hypothetical protein EGR_04933 [Echinococcus granulosus]EUB60223.1 hypothetical protein EGR_04933 [Echinococcus granulosus]
MNDFPNDLIKNLPLKSSTRVPSNLLKKDSSKDGIPSLDDTCRTSKQSGTETLSVFNFGKSIFTNDSKLMNVQSKLSLEFVDEKHENLLTLSSPFIWYIFHSSLFLFHHFHRKENSLQNWPF